ncbi:CAP domain-containing protein [Pedobacter rhizosphaerae]|nr:CAP domain-containing protein [Pedobacter rhizosphaerae]
MKIGHPYRNSWLMALLVCLLFTGCQKDEIDIPELNSDVLLEKINQLRLNGCQCGADYMPPVEPLLLNSQLGAAATKHVLDMYQRAYFDHLSPEGTTPAERAAKAGYQGHFRSENIGRGYVNPEVVLLAWKNSVSHCKAMMDSASREAGFGFSHNYWTASFGYP